jgi:membrane fusion protein, multidrug efflux system
MSSSPSEGSPVSASPAPGAARRSGRARWIFVLILLLVLAYVGWRIFGRSAPATQAQAPAAGRGRMAISEVPVVAATAKQGDIGVYVAALGTVTPVYTVTVTSRVQGQIMQIHYREGQMVRKGDPLIEIDPRPYQAALTQAEGQLAHDQALLTESRIDLDRYQAAFSRNAIAKQQVDDQQQLVKQYEGTVKNDEGTVENARVNLVYCHIASPIDGRVGLRLVDPGNIVQANSSTSLVVVTQLQPITVIFNVAEDYLGEIQAELRHEKTMEVDVFDRAVQKKLATGKLLTVDNQIDTSTGTVKLRAIFNNSDLALFPNQFVNAKLLVNLEHNVTLVPTPAVQRNSQGTYVYVIGSDLKASLRQVKEGTSDGNVTAVQGLNPGEVVATDGFDKLQDGIKVRVRGDSKSATAAPSGANQAKPAGKEAATR